MTKRRTNTTASSRSRMTLMTKCKLAGVSVVLSVVLWCVARVEAGQQKIIIEDTSGPWILIAAVVSAIAVVAAPLIVRALRK